MFPIRYLVVFCRRILSFLYSVYDETCAYFDSEHISSRELEWHTLKKDFHKLIKCPICQIEYDKKGKIPCTKTCGHYLCKACHKRSKLNPSSSFKYNCCPAFVNSNPPHRRIAAFKMMEVIELCKVQNEFIDSIMKKNTETTIEEV